MSPSLRVACVVLMLPVASGAERLLATHEYAASECTVALESYEGVTGAHLRLRPACELSLDSTRRALADLLPRALTSTARPPVLSLFLGRIVEYPWLSERLVDAALQSGQWSAKRGQLRSGATPNINAFVADLLKQDAELRAMLPGWELTSVTAEKVLIGPAKKYLATASPHDKAPFDAMLWLRLRPEQ
jgi:hypothetical protein